MTTPALIVLALVGCSMPTIAAEIHYAHLESLRVEAMRTPVDVSMVQSCERQMRALLVTICVENEGFYGCKVGR